MYVTLVPWRRERRRHVPLPRLLYHRWAAGSPARLLSENLNMRCTCCLLILTLWSAAAGCNNRMPMCIGSFSYTRSGLVSLSEIPICRSPDVASPFPPSGNEGYIRNRDVFEGKKEDYSAVAKSISWSQLDWACISLAEDKTKGRKTHKQTTTEVGCSKGLAKHHKGGNQVSGDVHEFQA